MKNPFIRIVILAIFFTAALIKFSHAASRSTASRVEFGSMIDDSLAERNQAAKGFQEKVNVEKINVYQKRNAFQINKLDKNPEIVNVNDSKFNANYHSETVAKNQSKRQAKKTSRSEIEKQNTQLEQDIANTEGNE